MFKKIGKKLWTVIGSAVLLPALYVGLTSKGVDDDTAVKIVGTVGALVGIQMGLHTTTDVAAIKAGAKKKEDEGSSK